MSNFEELSQDEVYDMNAGGILSAVAGGLAGGIIGTVAGLIPAVVKGDASIIAKSAITGGTVGVWAGSGFPLP